MGMTGEKTNKGIGLYRCPICHAGFTQSETGSLVCGGGHCFDLAKKGYVNFVSGKRISNYSKELFLHRKKVFEDGFYEVIAQEIKETVRAYCGGRKDCAILDAGCGEGYYTAYLAQDEALAQACGFFAFDISKDAIVLAAKPADAIHWMVADIANIPLQDKSMDIILDILTPANYGEFGRLLKDGGLVIKAIPGEDYLQEIRERIAGQLKTAQYQTSRVTEHMEGHLRVISKNRLTYRREVTGEQLNAFLHMTPMTHHVDLERVDWRGIDSITIDMEIIVGAREGI